MTNNTSSNFLGIEDIKALHITFKNQTLVITSLNIIKRLEVHKNYIIQNENNNHSFIGNDYKIDCELQYNGELTYLSNAITDEKISLEEDSTYKWFNNCLFLLIKTKNQITYTVYFLQIKNIEKYETLKEASIICTDLLLESFSKVPLNTGGINDPLVIFQNNLEKLNAMLKVKLNYIKKSFLIIDKWLKTKNYSNRLNDNPLYKDLKTSIDKLEDIVFYNNLNLFSHLQDYLIEPSVPSNFNENGEILTIGPKLAKYNLSACPMFFMIDNFKTYDNTAEIYKYSYNISYLKVFSILLNNNYKDIMYTTKKNNYFIYVPENSTISVINKKLVFDKSIRLKYGTVFGEFFKHHNIMDYQYNYITCVDSKNTEHYLEDSLETIVISETESKAFSQICCMEKLVALNLMLYDLEQMSSLDGNIPYRFGEIYKTSYGDIANKEFLFFIPIVINYQIQKNRDNLIDVIQKIKAIGFLQSDYTKAINLNFTANDNPCLT